MARQVVPSKLTLQRGGDLQSYSVRRDKLVPRGSALHMHHLSVVVVEFADTDTAQKIIGLIPITNLIIGASL